jgi:Phage portal protein, SPP1 Gp6-like
LAELDPGTPEWWVKRLYAEHQARQNDMQLYRDLVDGVHEPAFTAEASVKFATMAEISATNLCGLVVETTAQRLEVEGFRFGDDPDDDKDAWRIWQASDFDAGSGEAITQALTYGRGFISVDPNDGDPLLLQEDARQVVVAYSPEGRRDRIAALKVFNDEWTGTKFATLYLPDEVYKFEDVHRSPFGDVEPAWAPRAITGEPVVSRNPLGEVPFFELRNRPLGRTKSEIAGCVIPQRRLNQAVYNALAVAEYGAFRQKWATGIEVPRDPVTGQPVSPFNASVTKIFLADGDAKFGDFGATDLTGYIDLIQLFAMDIARAAQLPATFFLKPENLAAETVALLVSSLIKKCERRVKFYEPAIEGAMRCAFRVLNDPRALEMRAETRWASMETRTVAQDADAAVKLTQGENPVITPQTAQERYLGMSQTERDRDNAWRLENGAGAQLAGLLSVDEFTANQPA